MATKKNILVGAASIFLGPSGAANAPAIPAVAPFSYRAAVAADEDWTDVGFTQDGLEVANDPSYG